jgi:hypothetical protein
MDYSGNLTNIKFKDGDDDGEEFAMSNVNIETVTNGWILRVTDSDDEETTEVFSFSDSDGLMEAIQTALGAS